MEQFENNDELTDRELGDLLAEWRAPLAPVRLRLAVFPQVGAPWWKRLWTASIRVPVPVAVCLAILLALAGWRFATPVPPRVIVKIKTEPVEVPVVTERLVTKIVYRDGPVADPRADLHRLQPVAELRPRIIRSQHAEN